MVNAGAAGDEVMLVGFDFGSTTSSAMAARARIALNCATGRQEFQSPRVVYRSEPVFTPFRAAGDIDICHVERHMERWLAEGGIAPEAVFSGGAIVTGLASEGANAEALAKLVEARLGDAIIATARDPALESWLAFMGSCAGLSRALPTRAILNLDIGGGTTNAALGEAGEVIATGCHFIGARHLRFAPGTYRLAFVSRRARAVLDHLGIAAREGDALAPAEVAAVTGFLVRALEALAEGDAAFFQAEPARLLVDVPLALPGGADPAVTFSGGVGELVYAARAGADLPPVTAFGDLGIDLACAILASPRLCRDLDLVPEHGGRATVCGLTLHATEVSGATLHLADTVPLPLRDLPILACLPPDADPARLGEAVALVARTRAGGCIRIAGGAGLGSAAAVKVLGARIAEALAARPPDGARPLVLLLADNAAKTLGLYATDFGRAPAPLLVIDEVPDRPAQFVRVGKARGGLVPISFYGLN
ncbi:ethanolamine ammonia-lyase reactivating factor EutA [Xanthobacter tagetidis]|uniref:Reactivating factor for ethanolamine ammonia lyase n=1 Tax=Xanthobacter tagetidis TaxID=60216 RepID=A0A3L7AIY0_9HYPH|nr:ethanolamine ammonia-lyase reactivating factor EutA [Xanthobacter tagetidis]MBB6306342.1 ethanolamine utilization protein EutA [Xanthobacter tagetidis]RLP79608.1 reactivating factor for ethanolamine ammonia lyase [Xanthobacter tagetidis]